DEKHCRPAAPRNRPANPSQLAQERGGLLGHARSAAQPVPGPVDWLRRRGCDRFGDQPGGGVSCGPADRPTSFLYLRWQGGRTVPDSSSSFPVAQNDYIVRPPSTTTT